MKTIELKLYEFKELSPEVQKKVIEENRYINVEPDDDTYVVDHWKNDLDEMGFENAEIHYRGFNSQGDGASFDADINTPKFIKHFKLEDKYKKILEFIEKSDNTDLFIINIEKNSWANIYCHENTRNVIFEAIDADESEATEAEKEELRELEKLAQELAEDMEAQRLDACNEIYAELAREYEYGIEDEQVEEALTQGGYTFEADGTMRNE